MATYHLTMTNSAKAKMKYPGATAQSRADYIAREGKFSRGEKAEELVYKEHGNMPEWARENPRSFWEASEEFEGAKGGTSYREIEIALPNELTVEEQIELTQSFVQKHLGNDYVYSFGIHTKNATLAPNQENPHAHIIFCDRKLDGIERDRDHFFKRANTKHPELGGARKDRERWTGLERNQYLEAMRASWAEMQNRALEKCGHENRVDHRSLEDQRQEALENGDIQKADALDRPPESHLGPKVAQRTVKLVKLQVEQARTVPEKIQARDDYYAKIEPSERAQHVFYIREYQRTKKAIEKEKQLGNEICNTKEIDERIRGIKSQLVQCINERREVIKQVITPERAEAIAQSVYLKRDISPGSTHVFHSGELMDHGKARFNFNPDDQESYFVKLKSPSGQEKVVWGVDLERALRDYGVKIGQKVELENRGRVEATVRVPVLDEARNIAGYEDKRVHRNQWEVREIQSEKVKSLDTPEAKYKIEQIKQGVLKKNEPQLLRLQQLNAEIQTLKKEHGELMNQKVQIRAIQQLGVSKPVQQKQTLSAGKVMNQAMRQLQHEANKLEKEAGHQGKGHIKIRREEDEPKRGRDFEM